MEIPIGACMLSKVWTAPLKYASASWFMPCTCFSLFMLASWRLARAKVSESLRNMLAQSSCSTRSKADNFFFLYINKNGLSLQSACANSLLFTRLPLGVLTFHTLFTCSDSSRYSSLSVGYSRKPIIIYYNTTISNGFHLFNILLKKHLHLNRL